MVPPVADSSRFDPGTVLDARFCVERLLGMGGMGAVYEVTHLLTKHRRAMKLLHPQVAHKRSVVERFLREASAAGRIGNPHITETFDAGWLSSGEPYLVMELLDGLSLAERLRNAGGKGLELGETIEIVSQICDGIQAAHDAGIVHRDLKPDNVFLVRGRGAWFVKLLDFGVSKFDEGIATRLTVGDTWMGTPAYMSPEQFESGADVDPCSDVYSIGVILYEMLAGQHPYPATSLAQLARMVLASDQPPLTQHRPDLPEGVSDLLKRVLTARPDDRVQSARALADQLQALGDHAGLALSATALSERPSGASRQSPGATLLVTSQLDEQEGSEEVSSRERSSKHDSHQGRPASLTMRSASERPREMLEQPTDRPAPPPLGMRVPGWIVVVGIVLVAIAAAAIAFQVGRNDATPTPTAPQPTASEPMESSAAVGNLPPSTASALQVEASTVEPSTSSGRSKPAAPTSRPVAPPPTSTSGRAGMGDWPGQ